MCTMHRKGLSNNNAPLTYTVYSKAVIMLLGTVKRSPKCCDDELIHGKIIYIDLLYIFPVAFQLDGLTP